MDKLYAIKIRQSDGTYGAAIPVSVLAENVDWNSTLSLVDILGQVDTSESIQDQINSLKNTKATQASVNVLDQKVDNAVEYITHNSEIADARQGADGTEYSTLKERLDSEYDILQSQNASSLVIVNEEPEDTTKVNITTSENEIELALQSDLDAVETDVTRLCNRKIIFIADSYGQGDVSLPSRIAGFMGLTVNVNAFISVHGGYGFASSQGTFLSLLEALDSTITDKDSITDIVVLGGCNDRGITSTPILQAIGAFGVYRDNNYPNATIHIGFVGRTTGQLANDNYTNRLYIMGASYVKNGSYISGVENINIQPAERSDGTHPSASVGELLARFITMYLTKATAIDAYIENKTISTSLISGCTSTSTPLLSFHSHGNNYTLKQTRDLFNVSFSTAVSITANAANRLELYSLANAEGLENACSSWVPCKLTMGSSQYDGMAMIEIVNQKLCARVWSMNNGVFVTGSLNRIDIPRFTIVTDTLNV